MQERATRRDRTRDSPGADAQLAGQKRATRGSDDAGTLDAAVLAGAPAAVRRRALRAWLTANGISGLTDLQLRAADDLVGRWRGQCR